MNIKDYIIQNFKDDNLETIEKAIDDSVNEYNVQYNHAYYLFYNPLY